MVFAKPVVRFQQNYKDIDPKNFHSRKLAFNEALKILPIVQTEQIDSTIGETKAAFAEYSRRSLKKL